MSSRDIVEFDGESFSVAAALIAGDLGVTERQMQQMMKDGTITSRCERGVGDDEGRYRLTFFSGRRRLHLTVDSSGQIIDRQLTRRINTRGQPSP